MGGGERHEFELYSDLDLKIFLLFLAGHLEWRRRLPCYGEPHHFLDGTIDTD